MATRRTTVAAEQDDLALLEAEAQQRGVSLAQVLREAVEREAKRLRRRRRPRFGVARSRPGTPRAANLDEQAPIRERKGT